MRGHRSQGALIRVVGSPYRLTLARGFLFFAAPIAVFVSALHVKTGKHDTSIAVLEAQITSDKLAHDREMKDVKEALRSIASKLDSIELALREK